MSRRRTKLSRPVPKLAKDGSHRGRPALFGEAGRYQRLYAEVPGDLARKIRELAKSKKTSLSSILAPIAEGAFTAPIIPISKDAVRIYVQLAFAVARRLKAEARRRECSVSTLLGTMAIRFFGQEPEVRRIAT